MKVFSRAFALLLSTFVAGHVMAATSAAPATEWLIKIDAQKASGFVTQFSNLGAKMETLTRTLGDGTQWVRLAASNKSRAFSAQALQAVPGVVRVQPNYKIHLLENYKVADPVKRAQILAKIQADNGGIGNIGNILGGGTKADNPEIPKPTSPSGSGSDPLYQNQWGMNDIGSKTGWKANKGAGFVVAVIDTGVDYTHEDLVDNMWHNPGETGLDANGKDKATNGIDDDGNGYVDDVVGWDFAANDNKPFDLTSSIIDILTGGGNPGHGTHCAGNVAGRGENGKGIAGVAPNAKIMALRFITEKGEGTTDAAIKAIQYSIKMGVKVTSNSWGSEGEDPQDQAGNQALKDAIEDARRAGQIFVAAAGNGHQGVGYDNDTDAKPGYPASYSYDNIISVAAIDKSDQLGSFSNWGKRTVHIGAPGVAVFSTTSDGKYNDSVIPGLATWDGTSMAAPHVAGAAALYWADHPTATYSEVRAAILKSAKPISALNGKTVSNGKLSIENLMK